MLIFSMVELMSTPLPQIQAREVKSKTALGHSYTPEFTLILWCPIKMRVFHQNESYSALPNKRTGPI